jgi:flagellar biosynthesis protein FlhB
LPAWRIPSLAEESDLERTEPPSGRRIEKAREEGQIPHSRELMAFLVMAMSVSGFWALGGWLTRHAEVIVRHGLAFDRGAVFDVDSMGRSLTSLSGEAALLMAPLFVLAIAGAFAAQIAVGGWVFAPKALTLNLSRMDPIQGIKRLFSLNSLSELVKAIMKALLVGGVIYWVVRRQQDQFFALIMQPLDTALTSFGHMLIFASIAMVVGVGMIAAMDVPYQLWSYYRGLRMTKEELKQEFKEMEGDPQLKARIRSQQREMARKRMMAEVPTADVVVTNPTHFAVALKYDREHMGAPLVVAKGMNLIAGRIRAIAAEHQVPILEAPPLARALHRHAEIGDQIPASLYTAVAEVLAYVYQLGQYVSGGMPAKPQPPTAIAIPPGLDPGELAAVAA